MDQVGGVSSIFLYIQLTGIAKLLYLFKKKHWNLKGRTFKF